MADVNLWELITYVASKPDAPNHDKCKAVLEEVGAHKPSFATELSLEVDRHRWKVRLFNLRVERDAVDLDVSGNGDVTVTRVRDRHGIEDYHAVTF